MNEESTYSAKKSPSRVGRFAQNKKAKLAAVVAAVLIVVGGASAGAYYGVVVPNQPENLLKKSIENTLKLDKISGDGRLDFTGPEPEKEQVIVDYRVKTDSTNKTSEIGIEAAYSGVKLPLEIRTVDKSVFVKIGDLGSIKGVAELAQPGTGALVESVGQKVSNQWIEIDESLLQQAVPAEGCDLNGIEFTDQDIDQLLTLYENNTFVTITNSTDEKVGDKNTKKLDLAVDKAQAKEFGNKLKDTDIFKRIEKCDEGNTLKDQSESAPEDFKGEMNFSVWVDKSSKQIAKMQLDVKPENEGTVKLDFTFNDDEVNIARPEGAKPALEVFGELGPLFGGLLGGGLGADAMMSSPAATSEAADPNAVSPACMAAFQAIAASGDISALPPECQALVN